MDFYEIEIIFIELIVINYHRNKKEWNKWIKWIIKLEQRKNNFYRKILFSLTVKLNDKFYNVRISAFQSSFQYLKKKEKK